LVEYKGVCASQQETVISESKNMYALYAERDKLDAGALSLTARRHGVRPVNVRAIAA
jgi:hypothetical protein